MMWLKYGYFRDVYSLSLCSTIVQNHLYNSFHSLLVSGGADVIPLKIPVRNPARVADSLGYIFVSEQNSKSFVHLIDYGVLCIKPEFIGDFLIKVSIVNGLLKI